MTRETKVGLVLGTGIILLIGIVVSDHLSAQKAMQEKVAAPPGYGESASAQGGLPGSGAGAGAAGTIDPSGQPAAGRQAAGGGNAPVPPVNQLDQPRGPARGPAVLDNQAMLHNRVGTAADAGGTGNAATPGTGNPDLDRRLASGGFLPGTPGGTGNGTGGTPTLNIGGAPGSGNSTTPGANTSSGATSPPPPADTRTWHTVVENQSLWAIAQHYYGNGKYHEAIAKANADKLLGGGHVREGVRLLIPPKEAVVPGATPASPAVPGAAPPITNGATPTTPPASPAIGNGNGAPANADPARRQPRTITIEPGENLTGIARRELGSANHVKLIVEANRDKIRDENDIKAGMTLIIPQPPASAAPAPAPSTLPAARPATPAAPAPAAPAPTPGTTVARTYTVQFGDTFSSIARERLGNDKRWKEIFELNKRKIGNPDSLREGTVLVMPANSRL